MLLLFVAMVCYYHKPPTECEREVETLNETMRLFLCTVCIVLEFGQDKTKVWAPFWRIFGTTALCGRAFFLLDYVPSYLQ